MLSGNKYGNTIVVKYIIQQIAKPKNRKSSSKINSFYIACGFARRSLTKRKTTSSRL